jgi:hypothetical protein
MYITLYISNKLSITQLLVVCIDGSMKKSIMNHNGTKTFSYVYEIVACLMFWSTSVSQAICASWLLILQIMDNSTW